MRSFVLLALAIIGLSTPALADGDGVQLQPTSKWHVEYAKDYCAIRRTFGDEGVGAKLEMRQYAPGAVMDFLLVSRGLNFDLKGAVVRIPPNSKGSYPHAGYTFTSRGDQPGFFTKLKFGPESEAERGYDLTPHDLDALKQWAAEADAIIVETRSGDQIRLQTGALDGASFAMEQCLTSLVSYWGVNAEEYASMARNASPTSFNKWHKWYRHSMRALGAKNQGAVRMRLMVDAFGRISSCHNIGPDATKKLSQGICGSLQKRARFDPAIDKEGHAMRGYFILELGFAIGRVRHFSL